MQHTITLTCGTVVLRPLRVDDASLLRAIVTRETWAGMSTPLPDTDSAMADHLAEIIGRAGGFAFAVERSGRFVGRTTFYDLVPRLRVEVGNTIYDRRVWGTEVNPAAKLLLLGYAFNDLGVCRVALRCDHRNTRSHRAIARLGATFEGTLRSFRPAADGSIADIDYFSVIRSEWPDVQANLAARVAAAPAAAAGPNKT